MFTEQLITLSHDSATPSPALLDATADTAVIRLPVVSRLTIVEFGVRVVAATATGTTFTLTLKGEPTAGGTAVTLAALTGTTTITQGQCGRRITEVNIDPATYSFISLRTANGAASSTGFIYIKYREGGSFASETNDVIFTS